MPSSLATSAITAAIFPITVVVVVDVRDVEEVLVGHFPLASCSGAEAEVERRNSIIVASAVVFVATLRSSHYPDSLCA